MVMSDLDNVSERRRAEQRYRDLVNGLDAIVWEGDAETMRPTFMSQRAQELLGYPTEWWLSEPDCWARVIPSPEYEQVVTQCRAAIAERRDHELEYPVLTADGRRLWMHDRVRVLVDELGRPIQLRGIMVDITEQKRMEESRALLSAIVESSTAAIVTASPQGLVNSWNPSAEQLLGYSAAEMIGQPIARIFPPDALDDELAPQRLLAGETVSPFDTQRVARSGRRIDVSATPSSIRDAQGRVTRIAWILRDITERKESERQNRSLAQSEKLRALGQMASGIAHDLNQALALVSGYGELARQALTLDPPDLQHVDSMLEIMVRAAADGGQTVRRLLTFASMPPESAAEPVSLSHVLREVAQLTAPRWRGAAQAEGRPISLHVDASGDTTIRGWPASLREALTNLVFNAVDALPHGGTIHLSARRQDDSMVLQVRDSGVGMGPEVQARIFEPFFTTQGERGTGLGLAMVFGIVERHEGRVEVLSAPGQGTTFSLIFPAVETTATIDAPPIAGQPAAGALRILAVDDEPALGQMVEMMLGHLGHSVVIATSGEDALERLERQPFDLVLSDVGMGEGMNGWQLAEIVRQRWPRVRFLLATGWGAQIDPQQARERGVEAVLSKPYRSGDLQRIIAPPDPAPA